MGRGKSEGTQNAWGLGWAKDIAGALAFIKTREEVDPERIGALGLSTGADVLVQLAGQRHDLKAVVADGTVAGSFEDGQRVNGLGSTKAPRLFIHQRPPRPRRSGARAARSSKRLRTCANSRARFLSALSELAALVFLRLTGTSRVSRTV